MEQLAALLLLLHLITGCTTLTKLQIDAELDQLCVVDGGLKIYETVTLPPEKFNKHNHINFDSVTQNENSLGPGYIWKSDTKYLHPGGDPKANPRMTRTHHQLIRRSDGRLLGESISYSRYGGDSRFINELMGGPPESSYRCPKGSISVIGGVFINSGKSKDPPPQGTSLRKN